MAFGKCLEGVLEVVGNVIFMLPYITQGRYFEVVGNCMFMFLLKEPYGKKMSWSGGECICMLFPE